MIKIINVATSIPFPNININCIFENIRIVEPFKKNIEYTLAVINTHIDETNNIVIAITAGRSAFPRNNDFVETGVDRIDSKGLYNKGRICDWENKLKVFEKRLPKILSEIPIYRGDSFG